MTEDPNFMQKARKTFQFKSIGVQLKEAFIL